MRVAASVFAIAFGACAPALAQTQFQMHPIVISNNANVESAGINGKGDIAATVFNSAGTALVGVIVNGSSVTRLPAPYASGGAAYPQVIDDEGDVLGYSYIAPLYVPHMFLFRDGKIVPEYNLVLVSTFGAQPFLQPNPIGLAGRRLIFYTNVVSLDVPTDPRYGVPAVLFYVPQTNTFQTAHGITAAGIVAGTAYSFGGPRTVFMGRGGDFVTLTPPGATSVDGGYINDAGQVAGSYVDAAGAPHGFVYSGGTYTSFDMPQSARSVTVTGISSNGRVVGSYVGSHGEAQHLFLYNGTTVSAFGTMPFYDTVSVAVNAHSEMAVAVVNGLTYRSYALTCSGPGC